MIEILHIRYSLKLIKTSLVYSLRDSRNDKNVKRDEAMTSTLKHASNVIPTERSDEGSQKNADDRDSSHTLFAKAHQNLFSVFIKG